MSPILRQLPPAAPLRWLPVSAVHDTVLALESEWGPDRLWVGRLFLLLICLALVSLAVVEVDVTTRASGWVRSEVDTTELRSPSGGVVEWVWVRSGARVRAGQPLVQVSDPALASRKEALEERCEELAVAGEDWAGLLRAGQHELDPASAPVFRTAWAARFWADFVAQDAAHLLAEKKARREAERLERLGRQGLVSERDLDDARHEAESRGTLRQAGRERQLAAWQERARDIESQRLQAEIEGESLDRQIEALVLRAPLDGELIEWLSLETGSVVVAGQPLGHLTPDEPWLIEAWVPARTAALIRPRQTVRASFPALPATEWGYLSLRVETIASDARVNRGEPLFRVVATPEHRHLRARDGRTQELRKGFVADLRFHLGRTTVLTFLRTRLSDWIEGPAAGEVPPPAVGLTRFLSPWGINPEVPVYPGEVIHKHHENITPSLV